MVEKTWTATDVRLGKLTITSAGSILHVERRYVFVDTASDVLEQVAGGRVVEDIEIADIPKDILEALQAIDSWTRAKALEKEGM